MRERDEGGRGCYTRESGRGGKACLCFLKKWFTKETGVNHFLNFNKGFSNQRKLFLV